MRELIVCGTGVHALEVLQIVERLNKAEPTYRLVGLLAEEAAAVRRSVCDYPVLGTVAEAARFAGAFFVTGYGQRRAATIPRERLISLVDPSCYVHRTARLGAGTVLYPGCFVGANARLGESIFCLSNSVINHDCVLEDFVTLATGACLAGYVHVGTGAYLGQACTVRQNTSIGAGSLVGTGAVVVKDVAPQTVVVGNPARKLRDRA